MVTKKRRKERKEKKVWTTIDKIEYWKISAKFIRYAGVETTIYLWRSHRLRRSKGGIMDLNL